MILLEESWADLFILGVIQCSLPTDTPLFFALPDLAQNVSSGKTVSALADMQLLQEVFAKFRHLHIDMAEYACLKAIVLFKPGTTSTFKLK